MPCSTSRTIFLMVLGALSSACPVLSQEEEGIALIWRTRQSGPLELKISYRLERTDTKHAFPSEWNSKYETREIVVDLVPEDPKGPSSGAKREEGYRMEFRRLDWRIGNPGFEAVAIIEGDKKPRFETNVKTKDKKRSGDEARKAEAELTDMREALAYRYYLYPEDDYSIRRASTGEEAASLSGTSGTPFSGLYYFTPSGRVVCSGDSWNAEVHAASVQDGRHQGSPVRAMLYKVTSLRNGKATVEARESQAIREREPYASQGQVELRRQFVFSKEGYPVSSEEKYEWTEKGQQGKTPFLFKETVHQSLAFTKAGK